MNNQTDKSGYKKMTGKEFMKTLDNTGLNLTSRKNPYQPSGKAVLIGNTLFVSEEDFSKLSKIETATETFENLIISQVLDQPTTEYNSFYHKSFFHNLNFKTMPGSPFGFGRPTIFDLINSEIEVSVHRIHLGNLNDRPTKTVTVYDGMKIKVKENVAIVAGQEMTVIECVQPLLDKLIEEGIKGVLSMRPDDELTIKARKRLIYLMEVYEARCKMSEIKRPKIGLYIAKMGELEFVLHESEFDISTVAA